MSTLKFMIRLTCSFSIFLATNEHQYSQITQGLRLDYHASGVSCSSPDWLILKPFPDVNSSTEQTGKATSLSAATTSSVVQYPGADTVYPDRLFATVQRTPFHFLLSSFVEIGG